MGNLTGPDPTDPKISSTVFVLTEELLATARAEGFADEAWVRNQTRLFVKKNNGIYLGNPEGAWLKWLRIGRERGFGKEGKWVQMPDESDRPIARRVIQ